MHFASGSPELYSLNSHRFECDERAVAVSASPVGNCIVLLSQRQLHFWTCSHNAIYLGSVLINGTTFDDNPATHILWHPKGEHLVVATLQRRILFFDIFLDIKNAEILALTYREHFLHVGSFSSRVHLTNEERLEAGIVTLLTAGGSNCFFACTTSGVVCVLGWFRQKVLHTWSCHFLSKGTHFFTRSDETGKDSTETNLRLTRSEILTGTIVDVYHSPQLKLTAFLLSNGNVILARSSVGNDFTNDEILFSGRCSIAASAARIAINSKHMLIVMTTHAGDVVCKIINEDLSLGHFWNGLKCLKSIGRVGPICDIQWSPDEELLCVGFYHHGVVVVHYSSVCVYSSVLACYSQRCVAEGCISLSWSNHNHQLFLIEPQQNSFKAFEFSKVISTPSGDSRSYFTPIISFNNDILRLCGHSPFEDGVTFNDVINIHSQYAVENYPLIYAAVSPDGAAVVISGKKGFVIFDRIMRRWRTLRDKNQEREMVCVAQPLWLHSLAVVLPVRMIHTRSYALRVYAHRYLDSTALLEHLPLERMPLQICECHDESSDVFLLVLDSSNTLLIWRCNISSEKPSTNLTIDVSLELFKRIKLPSNFSNPIEMTAIHPIHLRPHRAPRTPLSSSHTGFEYTLPLVLFILRGSHALVSLGLSVAPMTEGGLLEPHADEDKSGMPFPITTLRSSGVYKIWIDNSVPIDGGIILVFGDNGVSFLHLCGTNEGLAPFLLLDEYRIGQFDADSLPIGISTYDGCLLTASSTSDVLWSISGMSPIIYMRMTVKPILYNYRVLAALTRFGSSSVETVNGKKVPPTGTPFIPLYWSDRLFYWLERMRSNNTFVPNADYYLHTLIDETPPAGIDQLDRRSAVQATVSLLRRYSEFYSILVSCVRKVDVSRWQVVLDVLGSPLELFRECLENQRFEEAAHLLRVIMMDGTLCNSSTPVESLENAMTSAAQLLVFALWQRNVSLIHDLLRFASLLHAELVIPVIMEGKDENVGVWSRFWNAVGFQQNSSNMSLSETDPFCIISAEQLPSGGTNPDSERRRCAIEFLLLHYPNVKHAVNDVATKSLISGHLILLRDILQEFSLSLPHFIRVKRSTDLISLLGMGISTNRNEEKTNGDHDNDNSVEKNTIDVLLPDIFDGIHDELGLPRSMRCIGSDLRQYLSYPSKGEITSADPALWTIAQSHIYSTPGVVNTLLDLRRLYNVWEECVTAINIVLMSEVDVIQQLQLNPLLNQTLLNLVTQPKNQGYEVFLRHCIKGSTHVQAPPLSIVNDMVK
ncbi:Ribosome control protein 1 [Trypanosoma melophagium]|uniref:Ribosome control protein 1 n=1 Tax=Trypanosoma melophagium TaxID=715481 RepID=UPI00351A3B48|nr:Ribosome control protein 1 [Trypanosoma melophagium]